MFSALADRTGVVHLVLLAENKKHLQSSEINFNSFFFFFGTLCRKLLCTYYGKRILNVLISESAASLESESHFQESFSLAGQISHLCHPLEFSNTLLD